MKSPMTLSPPSKYVITSSIASATSAKIAMSATHGAAALMPAHMTLSPAATEPRSITRNAIAASARIIANRRQCSTTNSIAVIRMPRPLTSAPTTTTIAWKISARRCLISSLLAFIHSRMLSVISLISGSSAVIALVSIACQPAFSRFCVRSRSSKASIVSSLATPPRASSSSPISLMPASPS